MFNAEERFLCRYQWFKGRLKEILPTFKENEILKAYKAIQEIHEIFNISEHIEFMEMLEAELKAKESIFKKMARGFKNYVSNRK